MASSSIGEPSTSTSTKPPSTNSTSTTTRKRSGKRFVKGPRQPRPSPTKSTSALSAVAEHPHPAEPGADIKQPKGTGEGTRMSVDMEAVAQVDMTAVRVEAMHEFMMYLAQLVRESGMIAREQLRLTMQARGEDVKLPHTPALDGGFLPGPASRLLGVAFGTDTGADTGAAPGPAPATAEPTVSKARSPSVPLAPPQRQDSSRSSPLHAPTPVMGTINDHAKHLEDIVEDSIPPLPPPQLPQQTHTFPSPVPPPVPPAPTRVPSAYPSYGGPISSTQRSPAHGGHISPNPSAPAMSPAQPEPSTVPAPAASNFQSLPSLPSSMYYPLTNPYTNGMGRYPPFVTQTQTQPQSQTQAQSQGQSQSQPQNPYAQPSTSGYNAPASAQQAYAYHRNSWAGYPATAQHHQHAPAYPNPMSNMNRSSQQYPSYQQQQPSATASSSAPAPAAQPPAPTASMMANPYPQTAYNAAMPRYDRMYAPVYGSSAEASSWPHTA